MGSGLDRGHGRCAKQGFFHHSLFFVPLAGVAVLAKLHCQVASQVRVGGIRTLLINLPSPVNIKRIFVCKCISAVQFIGTNFVMDLL